MINSIYGHHISDRSQQTHVHTDLTEFVYDPSTKTVRKTQAKLIPNELDARMFDIENSLARGDNQDIIKTPYLRPSLEQMDLIVRNAVSDIEDRQINIELDFQQQQQQLQQKQQQQQQQSNQE